MRATKKNTSRPLVDLADELMAADLVLYILSGGGNARTVRSNAAKMKQSLPAATEKDGKTWYRAVDVAKAIKEAPKDEKSEKMRKLKAEADLAETRAASASLALKTQTQELVLLDAVKDYLSDFAAEVRGAFLGLGSGLALTLAPMSDPRDIEHTLTQKVREILEGIGRNHDPKTHRWDKDSDPDSQDQDPDSDPDPD